MFRAYFHGDHTPLAPRLMTYLNNEGEKQKNPTHLQIHKHSYKQMGDNALKMQRENLDSL